MSLDVESARQDFPILQRHINGRPLIYLDSGATSLKPKQVIARVEHFYCHGTANVHRAVHLLSEEATDALEASRETIARFINADSREVAFVRNSTEALNVIAHTYTAENLVAMPLSEHHSNLLPWRRGNAAYIDLDDDYSLSAERATAFIKKERPSVLAFSAVSNALGYRLPVAELIEAGRSVGATIVIDLSQSVGHEPVDVQAHDCDFAVFSGHKMLGPSGIGILYQSEGVKKPVKPVYLGGEMVHEVHIDEYEARPFPWCMEAGTPNIEGVLGLAAACEYLEDKGLHAIEAHCSALCASLYDELDSIERISMITPRQSQFPGLISFHVDGHEAHGIARILSNRFSIMTRSGFHCAQPFHEAKNVPETVRASVHLYNTQAEIAALVEALKTIISTL